MNSTAQKSFWFKSSFTNAGTHTPGPEVLTPSRTKIGPCPKFKASGSRMGLTLTATQPKRQATKTASKKSFSARWWDDYRNVAHVVQGNRNVQAQSLRNVCPPRGMCRAIFNVTTWPVHRETCGFMAGLFLALHAVNRLTAAATRSSPGSVYFAVVVIRACLAARRAIVRSLPFLSSTARVNVCRKQWKV